MNDPGFAGSLSPVSLADVLQAFLLAELDSPTEAQRLRDVLATLGIAPTAAGVQGSDAWQVFSAYRGGEAVFAGLDWQACQWFTGMMTASLLPRLWCCRNHFAAQYGTRLLPAIAQQWTKGRAIRARVAAGETLLPPIVVGADISGKLVVVEGHNRLLAYCSDPGGSCLPTRILVGLSPTVVQWNQWPGNGET